MKRNVLIVILFLSGLLFLFWIYIRMDIIDITYPNYDAVIQAGALGKGKWIPEFLPRSAVNIRETHNIDTNEEWLFFNFNYSTDIENLGKSCKQVSSHNIVYPRYPGGWWPKTLYRRNEDTQSLDRNYEYYSCEDGGIIAIDSKKGEVFYWHLG